MNPELTAITAELQSQMAAQTMTALISDANYANGVDPVLAAFSDPDAVNGAEQMLRTQITGADYITGAIETATEGPVGAAEAAMTSATLDAGFELTGFGEPDPTPLVNG